MINYAGNDVKIMHQRDIKKEVQGLWLQYSGLKNKSSGKPEVIENAAHMPGTQIPSEDMPEIPGLIIAT